MSTSIPSLVVDRATLLFLEGRTIRSLARQFKIPKSTLHYHVQKKTGNGVKRSGGGSIAIIEEHLRGRSFSRNQRNAVRRWVAANASRILAVDAAHETVLMTCHREQAISNAETGSRCDFRANLLGGDGDVA